MSKDKLPTLMLLVKLNASPPSLAILEHVNDNIQIFKKFCRIRITSFTSKDLENPRILKQLEDRGIAGLPALITHKGNALFGVESISKFIQPANFRQEIQQEKRGRSRARRLDDDELVDNWNAKMMDINDQEDTDRDHKKDITAKQSEDLRDNRLSKLVNRAKSNTSTTSNRPLTSIERVNKARHGNISGKQRSGPERQRDTAPVSEMSETSNGMFREEIQSGIEYDLDDSNRRRIKQKIQDDDDFMPADVKPPGRSNGASIRNKALNGASKSRAQRSDNLDVLDDDEDAVDKMLKTISKNSGLD